MHPYVGYAQEPDASSAAVEAANEKIEQKIEPMYEYGYRRKDYAPDELVTDSHGNPISAIDAMMKPRHARDYKTLTPHLAYYSPRIPGNTGSAIRLCAVTGTILHLIEPLGFNLGDTKLRRAGLDYHDMAHVVLHPNFQSLVDSMPDSRIIAFTANATKNYTDIEYRPTDILLFGPEPGDIPDPMDIMFGPDVAEQVRLPMLPSARSLNLTNTASIAVYEAWRQLGFAGAK
jgi:tRNA (cytidine/uridine-2'-O-)-methyltransferase